MPSCSLAGLVPVSSASATVSVVFDTVTPPLPCVVPVVVPEARKETLPPSLRRAVTLTVYVVSAAKPESWVEDAAMVSVVEREVS